MNKGTKNLRTVLKSREDFMGDECTVFAVLLFSLKGAEGFTLWRGAYFGNDIGTAVYGSKFIYALPLPSTFWLLACHECLS